MKTPNKPEASIKSSKWKWVLPDKPQLIFLASILVLCSMILLNELLDFPDLIRGTKTNPIDWYKFATEMSAIMLVTLSGSVLLRKTESKRRRAEDEIKILKRQMEFILGVTKTGLDIIDSEFNIRYIDPEWQKVYGDPTGIKCHNYFMGRNEVCPGCGIVKALEEKKVAVTEEILVKEDDRPIQVTTIPYQDDRGEWLVAEVNVDITERRKLEKALKGSEWEKGIILDSMSEMVMYQDREQRIVWANRAACEWYGLTPDKLIGRHCYELRYNRTECCPNCPVLEAFRTGQPQENEIHAPNGRILYVRSYPARDERGEVVGGVEVALDITERKQVETALSLSEQRLNKAQAIAHIGNWDWNIEENNLSWSDELYWIFGIDRGTFVLSYESIEKLIHPDDRDMNHRQVNKLLESGESGEYFFRAVRPDGEIRYLNQIFEVIRDQKGTAIQAFGTIQDITESKQAEEALKESEEKYRALIEAAGRAGKGIIIIQDKGEGGAQFVFVNDQFCKMSGYSQAELVGRSPWDLIPREISIQLKDWYRRRHMGESLPSHYKAAGVCKDGTIMPLELSIVTMPWQGKIATVLYLRDITERKQAEEALRESEGRFRQLAENIDQVFWLTDWENDKLLYVSPSYEKMFGRSCQSAYQDRLSWYQVIHPDDRGRVKELLVKNAEMGQNTEVEYRIIRDDGEVCWILDHNYPIRNQDGKVYRIVSIADDITERKRAEQALKENEERLELVLEGAELGTWDQNMKTGEVIRNRRWAEMLGYTLEEIEPNSDAWKVLIHPDDLPVVNRIARDHETGRTQFFKCEHRMRTKLGEWKWILNSGKIIRRDSDGTPVQAAGTHADITERKRAEEALSESKRRLVEAQRIGKIGNWEWIPEENKVSWSAEMYAIFGVVPETGNLTTEMVMQAFHPDDRAMVAEATRKTLEELKPQPIECRILKPDGTISYVYGRGEVVLDANGKLVKMIGIYQDITERKKAEEALRESQKRFQALTETTSDFIWEMDANGVYTYCSPQIHELWGYKPEAMVGRTPFDLMLPEDRERAMGMFNAISESPSSFKGMETHSRDNTGRMVVVETSGVPFFDMDGRLRGYRGISRDITERKQAEEELWKSQAKLQSIFSAAPAGIGMTKDQTIQELNTHLCEITGYSKEELLGNSISMLYPSGQDYLTARSEIYRQLEEKGHSTIETSWQLKDGKLIYVLLNCALLSPGDFSQGITFTVLDISERKQAEEALKDSHTRFSTIFHYSPIAIAITRFQDNQLIDVNEAWQKITGYSREEVIGHTPIELDTWVDPAQRNQLIKQLQKGGMVRDFELKVRHRSGSFSDMLLTADLITLGGEPYMLTLAHDITEKKKMEAQLIQSERMGAVGTLAYGIAHEFNNILAGILGNAEFGLISKKRGEVTECLRIIMENCDRAKSITNNLLAFSTHRTVKKEEAGVVDAVESVLSLVERELEKHNVMVVRKFAPVPNIYCDIGELSQVVLNMVTNARDAMIPKGGTLAVEISQKKDNIEMIFSDTGCGIPDGIKSRIFEPFVTTKGALGQSEIPGTGLGLFLSYGIISRYGGKIDVESKVGKGSIFTVTIPISINQTPPDFPKEEERSHIVPENLNILLVDDEKPILNSIQSFLETKGHSVVTTTKGKKGLRLFKDQAFDLVLSDITMPDMDGLELISKLKSINEKVKLIVITGHLEEEKLKSAHQAGADQILVKPFRNEEYLLKIIARALSS